MGSPGRQILHCIGAWPAALWPSCTSPLSWLQLFTINYQLKMLSAKIPFVVQVMEFCSCSESSFAEISFRNHISNISHGLSSQSCWCPQILFNMIFMKHLERFGATCKSWWWTLLGKAGSGSTSTTPCITSYLSISN